MNLPRAGQSLKLLFLQISKLLGLFYLSRHLTRHALRILCYHGFALTDEHLFRPQMFITPETFEQRLRFLQQRHFPVTKLEAALELLKAGNLPDCATVISIDDGFYSTYRIACPVLKKYAFPATLYVTTYYCVKQSPIFRLVVQYMFAKTLRSLFDLSELDMSLSAKFGLTDPAERDRAVWSVIQLGEGMCNEKQRLSIEKRLGQLLGVDFEHIQKARILSLLSCEEIKSLVSEGIDIQLHTHRHSLPSDNILAVEELNENRALLKPLLGEKEPNHLCYPSGKWSGQMWPYLEGAGIKSAVTCDPGLNYPNTPFFALRRFIDGEHISPIEFEAEMVGYMELLRRLRSDIKRPWVSRKADHSQT